MANANVSLQGAVNSAGDDRALFYKVFTGEVLAAYAAKNVMESRHRVRNIQNQKSASFANTGKAAGRSHTPGTEITGQDMAHNETVITVDDLLISDVFIADIFEAMNHYEVRGEYSRQLGEALARTFDKQVLRVGVQSARADNKITGLPGGTTLTLTGGYAGANDADKAIELADSIFEIHQAMLENDVDPSDAYCLLTPADYFRLVRNKDLLNQDWGGLGSYARAELPMVAGIPLVITNHLPQANDTTDGNGDYRDGLDYISAKYADDYSNVQALVLKPDAIGTVKLIDLGLQSEFDIRRQGTLMVARMAVGHGVLRPECAFEIVTP